MDFRPVRIESVRYRADSQPVTYRKLSDIPAVPRFFLDAAPLEEEVSHAVDNRTALKVFVALNTVCVSGDDGVRAESDEVPVPCPAPGRRNGIVFTAAVEDDDDLVGYEFFLGDLRADSFRGVTGGAGGALTGGAEFVLADGGDRHAGAVRGESVRRVRFVDIRSRADIWYRVSGEQLCGV